MPGRIDVTHEAATPAGLEVTATVESIAVEGRKLGFAAEAHDGVDLIYKGRHERYVRVAARPSASQCER
jgi:fluoroacetyl-CoA thioesterase